MSGEAEVRPAGSEARIEVVDVGRALLPEDEAVAREAEMLQSCLEDAERAAVLRGDARAADQIAG
jgi:hypothetical protein